MKKLFVLYILILTFSLIMAGCDNGSASDSVSSSNLVKVSLTVDDNASNVAQKIVTVDSGISNNLTYEYMAEALWTSSNIHGETNWTRISYSNADTNLGYFTSGQWKFSVRILDGSNVVYRGESTTYIAPGNANVTVLVSKQFEDAAAGQVHISVTAPTLAGENLGISYTLGNVTTNLGNASATSENGITTFEYTATDLAAGEYTFFLNYLSGSSGAAVAVDLRPGEEAQITGHLDNGIWQVGYLYLKLHTIAINASCNINTNVSSAAIGDRVSFSIEPLEGTILNEDGIRVTYGNNQTIIPEESVGGLYTFTMPDADVTINAIYEGISQDINIAYFKAAVKMLYNYNPSAKKFGRVANPLTDYHLKHYGVKNVTLWYDTSEKKICWYSGSDIVKFQPGSMANFFKDFTTLENINLTGFDTSDVTSMAGMFQNCTALTSVTFDTETDAEGKYVNFDTSSVEDMAGMFKNCKELYPTNGVLNLAGFDTFAVEDMSYMFFACYKLKEIVFGNKWDTSKVENMACMFAGYDSEVLHPMSLTTLNVANFDTSNVKYMQYMFYQCKEIERLNVSSWNTQNVENMSYMFAGLNEGYGTKLDKLHLTNWDFSSVKTTNRMFDRCQSLADLTFPETTNFKSLETMTYMFSHCTELTPKVFRAIVGTWTFDGHPKYNKNDPSNCGIYGNASSSFFGNHNGNTNNNYMFTDARNYIFRNTMTNTNNNHPEYGKFVVRKPKDEQDQPINYITKDNKQLWIGGGNDSKYGKLTTAETP